jgi:hypothetical protein
LAYLGDRTVDDLGAEELAEIPAEILANIKWVM